jgi:pimeloyl-ACP methyl ester carboxylesterase
VLVHGALCSSSIWEPVGKEFDARGIPHIAVDLPSVGVGVDPSNDVHGDAVHVRSVLDGIEGPVVLCGNSYGGFVITEASADHPNVAHLVYLAAFMPDGDEDLASFPQANCSPELWTGAIVRDDGLIDCEHEVMRRTAFQQAAPEAAEWALLSMRPMAPEALGGASGPVAGVGWRGIPSTVVVCTEDRTILPESQRRWGKERATHSVEVPFDHCPQVSHPAEVAEILAKVVINLP